MFSPFSFVDWARVARRATAAAWCAVALLGGGIAVEHAIKHPGPPVKTAAGLRGLPPVGR